MISISSLVMTAWRVRLNVRVSLSIISPRNWRRNKMETVSQWIMQLKCKRGGRFYTRGSKHKRTDRGHQMYCLYRKEKETITRKCVIRQWLSLFQYVLMIKNNNHNIINDRCISQINKKREKNLLLLATRSHLSYYHIR